MTYERPESLPQFAEPPVVEVRLELFFQPLSLGVTRLPELFALWRDRYPVLSETAPMPIRLASERALTSGVRIQFADLPPLPRVRLQDVEGTRWIELQSDALSCGWSRDRDAYPRYPNLRDEFHSIAKELAAVLEDDEILVIQASMNYVNVFDSLEPNLLRSLSSTFGFGDAENAFESLPSPSNAGLNLEFNFRNVDETYAVLSTSARCSHVSEQTETQFELRFTGDPFARPDAEQVDGLQSILGFFDEGHEVIVNAFTEATTPELHQKWGRY